MHLQNGGTVDNGIVTEANGRIIDPMEPSASTILDLMGVPKLTHKGEWISWFWGIAVCIIIVIYAALFDDALV